MIDAALTTSSHDRTPISWEHTAAAALAANADYRLRWDRLNASNGDLPFLSSDAMVNAIETFGKGDERLLIATRGSADVAMAVLVPQGRCRWATFQPSQLPLGALVAGADVSLENLGCGLMRGPLGFCLAMSFTQLDPTFLPRTEDSDTTRLDDYIDTGWIEISGTFEEYWAARGKNLRQNIRKQRNKLAADGVKTRMRLWTDEGDMPSAICRYSALESVGWKAAEGTAIHPDNAQGRFYTRLLTEAARRGEAAVYEYMFDERTVAMNLCLLRGGTLIVLKTTYDEALKSCSPASLLREEELQSFFAEQRIRRVEYYGKVMDWHSKLTDRKRTLYHCTVYRWPLLRKWALRRRQSKVAREGPHNAGVEAQATASAATGGPSGA